MTFQNGNIAALGYRLEVIDDVKPVRPLLEACGLEACHDGGDVWKKTAYLAAMTPAGGVAASVGWARGVGDEVVIHSLAVAPSSRGMGLGASMLATTSLYLREQRQAGALYIGAARPLTGYFGRLGYVEVDPDTLPKSVSKHPSVTKTGHTPMVRQYGVERHGLDQSAFCLIHNTTENALLPEGSVFWFRQSGQVLEAKYRGGPVARGHLLGAMEAETLRFLWQSCSSDGDLARGEGEIVIDLLDDGRRELREKLGADPGELLLREF